METSLAKFGDLVLQRFQLKYLIKRSVLKKVHHRRDTIVILLVHQVFIVFIGSVEEIPSLPPYDFVENILLQLLQHKKLEFLRVEFPRKHRNLEVVCLLNLLVSPFQRYHERDIRL